MFCPEIAGPDVIDLVTERSAWTVMMLCTTRVSKNTPQAGAAGLTSLQGRFASCVNSHVSRMDLPAIPFSFMWMGCRLAVSPPHADISCEKAGLFVRGKGFVRGSRRRAA